MPRRVTKELSKDGRNGASERLGTAVEPTRCPWCEGDAQSVLHHDSEWGVPMRDSRALWEHLILDGFQAGLSWRVVLHKRPAFRTAFAGFEPERVARFSEKDIEKLLSNPEIIRSRSKVIAAIGNAHAYLSMRDEGTNFADWVWQFLDGVAIQNSWRRQQDVPVVTPLAERIADALKEKGFKFVGPTLTYAWMQAVGLVNDHIAGCFRHAEVAALSSAGRGVSRNNPTRRAVKGAK